MIANPTGWFKLYQDDWMDVFQKFRITLEEYKQLTEVSTVRDFDSWKKKTRTTKTNYLPANNRKLL